MKLPDTIPLVDFEVPSGSLVFGSRETPWGPLFGVQAPGEPRPLELFPADARRFVDAMIAKGGRGRLAKKMLAVIRQVEYDREILGLPMNSEPTEEQQKLLLAAIEGKLAEHGLDVVGGEKPPEGGCIVGVIQRGEHFRVCVHNDGEPPAIMSAKEAREVAAKAAETGDAVFIEIAAEVNKAADECDRLTAQRDAGGLTTH